MMVPKHKAMLWYSNFTTGKVLAITNRRNLYDFNLITADLPVGVATVDGLAAELKGHGITLNADRLYADSGYLHARSYMHNGIVREGEQAHVYRFPADVIELPEDFTVNGAGHVNYIATRASKKGCLAWIDPVLLLSQTSTNADFHRRFMRQKLWWPFDKVTHE
jgi:hypothetical protein